MKRIAAAIVLALACAPASSLAQSSTRFEPFTVSDIRIDGLQRISSGTVFTYLPIERGDVVDQARAAEAIRALFRTGFFNDINLTRQGEILVISLTERPAINQITLVGNKDIKSEELLKGLKDIGLSEGETFDRLQLERVTQELVRQYNNRGKYNVSINPSVSNLDRNRVDITIDVKEGKAAKIKHINIVGNETFDDESILETWESDTTNWLSWYNRDDQYSREKLSGDLEKLNAFYLDRGYVDLNTWETPRSEVIPEKVQTPRTGAKEPTTSALAQSQSDETAVESPPPVKHVPTTESIIASGVKPVYKLPPPIGQDDDGKAFVTVPNMVCYSDPGSYKALLVGEPGAAEKERIWIPKSQIEDYPNNPPFESKNDVGPISIPKWLAERNGLDFVPF